MFNWEIYLQKMLFKFAINLICKLQFFLKSTTHSTCSRNYYEILEMRLMIFCDLAQTLYFMYWYCGLLDG
jgi:hypothetical protein